MIDSLIESARRVQGGDFSMLRPLRLEDAGLTLRWRQSKRAALLHRGSRTMGEQTTWIQSRPANELNFIIETKDSIPVGMLSLIHIDLENQNAEAARFLIGEEEAARGMPMAVEAMKLLYFVAFDQLHLRRVYGQVVEDNPLMLKWQKYLGMKEEGRLRQHILMNGRFQDVIHLGILESEFREVALPRMKGLIALTANPPISQMES